MQIFWFKDSKIGHLKQVNALLNELKKEIKFTLVPIECDKNQGIQDDEDTALYLSGLDETIMLIGAGHSTYPEILKLQKRLKTKCKGRLISVAILRPSKNLKLFNLIYAPQHDFNEKEIPDNVTTFQGSLASPSYLKPDANKGMIAIGGSSRHYKFDPETLMAQLHYILCMHQNYNFKIFNSRRTPEIVNQKIQKEFLEYKNANFVDYRNESSESLQSRLEDSTLKFVTPDSSNLVFESLSTIGKTYLIQVERPGYKRWFGTKKIRSSMNELASSKRVGLVSVIAKKVGVNISSITNPSLGLEPLAEVEKVAFSLIKAIKSYS